MSPRALWRRYLQAGINLAEYGCAPWETHRLTGNDLHAIESHHNTKAVDFDG